MENLQEYIGVQETSKLEIGKHAIEITYTAVSSQATQEIMVHAEACGICHKWRRLDMFAWVHKASSLEARESWNERVDMYSE